MAGVTRTGANIAAVPSIAARRGRLRIGRIGAAVLLLVAILLPFVLNSDYQVNLMVQTLIYAIAVLGLNFVLGFSGQLSLAQAAFWGIGSYTSALLATRLGVDFWFGLVAGAIVAALFGALLGFPALKLSGHYLAMTTIGFGIIIGLVLQNWVPLTGGGDGIRRIPAPAIGPLVFKDDTHYYYLMLAFVVMLAFLQARTLHSRAGRAFLAIRENELAAEATGVDTTRYKVAAFMLSAAYGGISGVLFAHSARYISPDSYSFDQSVRFLAMLVIGGSGSIAGPIVGAALLTVLPEMLKGLDIDLLRQGSTYLALYGACVMLAVVFLPAGIWSLFQVAANRLFGSRATPVDPYSHPESPSEIAVTPR